MALPKTIEWVTFDVYGTLIDWETGIWSAFKKEAARDGFPIEEHVNKDKLIDMFHATIRDVESGSYEMYAEVLRQTAVKVAKEIEWPLEPSRSGFLPDSVATWRPFRETAPQVRKTFAKYKTGLIANMDDKLLGVTRRHIPGDYDLVVTAQQVRSYKPDPSHFTEFARRVGSKKNWVHITSSYYHDVEPCLKAKVPVIYVNRRKSEPEPGQKKATEEVRTLLEAMKLLGL